jgi:alpha-1,3-rhamnosyl/mannosyltransferase
VEAATLAELTARADIMAFPSRYEGFGLPILEAMHRGTPVVAADATAIPEVLGDAGVLVDPGDVDGWADALSGLLGDDMRRAELAVAGTARAEAYSPASSVAALLGVWHDAVS